MGPSGSGKTTLLSILGCMLTPTEGTVRVRGQLDRRQRSRGSGQAPAREHRLRVPVLSSVSDAHGRRQCAAGARCARREPAAREGEGAEALAPVGLSHKIKALSARAQRRRTAAGGDCARGRRRSFGDPGRRADRGARQRERQGHHGFLRTSPRTRRAAFWSSPTIRAWCRSPTGSSISRTARIVREEDRGQCNEAMTLKP